MASWIGLVILLWVVTSPGHLFVQADGQVFNVCERLAPRARKESACKSNIISASKQPVSKKQMCTRSCLFARFPFLSAWTNGCCREAWHFKQLRNVLGPVFGAPPERDRALWNRLRRSKFWVFLKVGGALRMADVSFGFPLTNHKQGTLKKTGLLLMLCFLAMVLAARR